MQSHVTPATWRRVTVALALTTCLIGGVYVFVTPAGLPYDEPSHWATVQYYADHGRMPVLGDEGVTYEAQMGPVAYVADAVIVRIAKALGLSSETGFRLVRLFGVLQLAACVLVVGALTSSLISTSPAALAALAVIALNPMLLTMSASVQNDSLALLLGVAVLALVVNRLGDLATARSALFIGGLAGAAVLTKLTNWVIVVCVAAWLAWVHGRQALTSVAAYLAAVVVVCGWWFVRNVALYGDPTAASAVERSGVSFDRYRLNDPADLGPIVQQFVAYLWLPTEYVRNFISAPTIMKATLFVVTVAAIAMGSGRLGRAERRVRNMIVGVALLALGAWLVTYLAVQALAPRVTYLALPLWAGVLGLALARMPQRVAASLVVTLMVGLNVWCLAELAGVDIPRNLVLFP